MAPDVPVSGGLFEITEDLSNTDPVRLHNANQESDNNTRSVSLLTWYEGERNQYIGRGGLEATILEALSHSRMITLHGSGGMGKTRLALHCAAQVSTQFSDGVVIIALADQEPKLEAFAEAISSALNITGQALLSENLIRFLSNKNMLILLDNYEVVDSQEVADYLARLFLKCKSVQLLVTGREAVKLADIEQIINCDNGMDELEAQQLFILRAQLKRGMKWQPDQGDLVAIQRILQTTEAIPLAIELAAAWTDKRSLIEIATNMETVPFGEATQMPPRSLHTNNADRHQSLERCYNWSFGLLEDWAQEGFA